MRRAWRATLPLLLALLGAGALSGEESSPAAAGTPALAPAVSQGPEGDTGLAEPAPVFSEETESVLVEVPIEVLAGGRPVAGLSARDFEIYDNGRRQEILGLEAIDRREPGNDRGLPVAARRHFLLLFDLSFTSPGALARAREAALQAVETQLDPSDLVGVATFRLKEGVRLLLGFSPDRGQVRVTLDALEQVRPLELRPDPLRLYLGQPATAAAGGAGRPDTPAEREAAYAHLQHLIDREAAARSRRDVAVLSESLASLARLLRGAAGRKHLLFFSEGFAADLLTGEPRSGQESLSEAIRRGELARVDSDALFGSRATRDLLGRLTEEMRRADCSLHTIDISPLGQGQGKEGLFLLARDTGAVFFENHHRLGPAFAELLERTRLTYLMTYRPTEPLGDGSYRKIKVKLRGSLEQDLGARLSYRPGYFDAELAAFTEEERRLLLADRLLDRRPGRIKTRVFALPSSDLVRGKRYVPVVVEVAGDSFLEGRDSRKAPIKASAGAGPRQVLVDAQIFVYALNEDGGIADFFSQAIPFDLAKHGQTLERHGFKLFAPLLLPAGRFTLRALVRNSEFGHLGVASKHLSVAKRATRSRVPESLIDPEWLLVRADRRDLAELGPAQDALEHLRQTRRLEEQEKAATPPGGQNEDPKDGSQQQLYQEALTLLAEKPWPEALDALERFEVDAVAEDPQTRAPRLGRAELALAKSLAAENKKAGAEVLWPLIGAHHDLYFRHRSAHRPYLEQQSRLLVRALAELAAEHGDDGLQWAAAQALASIGSTLLYEGRSAGFELLERAIELDPASESAHLSLAAYYEKFGGPYEKAVSWLDQLVLRRPDCREGRLRLAINLLRLKGPAAAASWPRAREDAAEHFGRLLAEPQDDWITSLAAQELARFHRGEPDRAAALLEDALSRRPGDPEILIQLTYLYDRLGQPERSRELAERLSGAAENTAGPGDPAEGGARGRYNQWTSETLIAARRDLRDGATSRVGFFRRTFVPVEGASR